MVTTLDAVEIYEVIKPSLGDEASKKLLRYINEKFTAEVATKSDVAYSRSQVMAEIDKLRAEMHAEIDKLRAEMHAEIDKLRAEMHAEIARLRNDGEKMKLEMRFLFALLALLIILTNPRVLDLLGQLFTITR